MERLIEMLSHKRPHGSETEKEWVKKFITDPHTHTEHEGNIVIVTDPNSRTLFSAHTDTVHHEGGPNDAKYDADLLLAYKDDNTPLGADDAAGVWLLLEMIDAKIPGTYIFHRGEERGGIGSRWMKENRKELLKQYDRAIAFDRRGRKDVITHQGGTECCSPEFAKALCAGLEGEYAPCPGGSFTDTKNYIGLIPECTNVAVGYDREHSSNETLDVEHLMRLRERVLTIDWEKLPTVREPKEPVYGGYLGRKSYGGGWGYGDFDDFDDDFAAFYGYSKPRGGSGRRKRPPATVTQLPQRTPAGLLPITPDPRAEERIKRGALVQRLKLMPSLINTLTYQEMSDLAWADPDTFATVVWTYIKTGQNHVKARK